MTSNRPFENLVKGGKPASLRDVDPATSALVIIDMQNWDAHPEFGVARMVRDEGIPCTGYWERIEELVVPNNARLLSAFRAAGSKVVYTVPASHFSDFSDANPNCRRIWDAGNALLGEQSCDIRTEIAPQRGEAVIPKMSSGAWASSSIDYVLRQSGIRSLFFTGVVTNACVMLSALGAWDHGYDVHVVHDATATFTQQQQDVALEVFSMFNFGLWTTPDVVSRFAGPAERRRA